MEEPERELDSRLIVILLGSMYADLAIQPFGQSIAGGFKVVPGLQIHPELGFHREKASRSQGRIRGDAPLPMGDFIDTARRHTDCPGQAILTHQHRFEEILKKDFSRMDRRKVARGHRISQACCPRNIVSAILSLKDLMDCQA